MTKVKNYARFYALLKRMPGTSDDLKEQLVLQFTGGRTEHLGEMKQGEYDAMCNSMQNTVNGTIGDADFKAQIKSYRSKVLHWLQKIGVDTTDWDRVDAYCLDSRIAGKVFKKLTIPELEALIPKLKSISRKAKIIQKKKPEPKVEIVIPPELLTSLLNTPDYMLN